MRVNRVEIQAWNGNYELTVVPIGARVGAGAWVSGGVKVIWPRLVLHVVTSTDSGNSISNITFPFLLLKRLNKSLLNVFCSVTVQQCSLLSLLLGLLAGFPHLESRRLPLPITFTVLPLQFLMETISSLSLMSPEYAKVTVTALEETGILLNLKVTVFVLSNNFWL